MTASSIAARAQLAHPATPTTAARPAGWGRIPLVSLLGAMGLLIIAIADTRAHSGDGWSDAMFWVGMLILIIPVALRLCGKAAVRQERIGLVIILGIALYLVKVFHSPSGFSLSDEFKTWRTTNDILQGHHLFQVNPLLVIYSLYPGLAIVTTTLVQLSGLPLFYAALLVLGMARLMSVLAFYLLFEKVSNSAYVGGLATLLYMANPQYVFFDAQFAYESLALPFAVLILYTLACRREADARIQIGLSVMIVLGIGAIIITHHMTSYMLLAFLGLWSVAALAITRTHSDMRSPHRTVILIGVAVVTWLVYVASLTINYLAPVLSGAVVEIVHLIAGESSERALFQSYSGGTLPLWERGVSFAAVLFILIGLPVGLRRIWQDYRRSSLVLTLGIGALGYPASLGLRLTHAGLETAGRTSEFLFVAVALVLALGAAPLLTRPARVWVRVPLVGSWLGVLFVGGLIIGWPNWARLPGPYLVGADSRSVEPQGISAAVWTKTHLGTGHRIFADRPNRALLATYGEQLTLASSQKIPLHNIIFAPSFGASEQAILTRARLEYILIDRRIATALPTVGVYFEQGEPDAFRHTAPIPIGALQKFDTIGKISRIFDSGDFQIYDVGALRRDT